MRIKLSLILSILLLSASLLSQVTFQVGAYAGSASAKSITGLGFSPDVVIIQCFDNGEDGVIATSSMTAGHTKDMTSGSSTATGYITSLDADGFTLPGDVNETNSAGNNYQYIAFNATGDIKVSFYTGSSGTDNRNITGVGFQPELVFVIPENAAEAFYRPSSQAGDNAYSFATAGISSNYIQSILADGFQVGSAFNTNAIKYHYVAFNAVASAMAVGSYTGDGIDNRNYTGVGFQSYFALTSQSSFGCYRTSAVWGDVSLEFETGGSMTNAIQRLTSTGFELGTGFSANDNGETYHWAAFGGSGGSVMPIELLNFEAEAVENNRVKLSWATATEINNDFFTVERSKDGINFEALITVKASGNSNEPQSYEAVDDQPFEGTSYYRLKQTDFNGQFEYFNLVAVHIGVSESLNMNVYPNPAPAGNINLSLESKRDKEVLIVVQDMLGQEFYSKTILLSGSQTFAVIPRDKHLPPGIYHVIASSNDRLISRKIIVY